MGIVNFSHRSFLASLAAPLVSPAQSLIRWFRLSAEASCTGAYRGAKAELHLAPQRVRSVERRPSAFNVQDPARITAAPQAALANRVTVVREADRSVRRGVAGRMVISGRMADVCDELERMVQRSDARA
ncbi:MAG: hypothetical protein LH479_10595 [Polaromonas sp.]|nr:hypothetical protein [Polaromonas sp.]